MTVATATLTGIELRPDLTRVITRFYVPGREDHGPGDSRAAPVIERLLHLGEDEVDEALRGIDERFLDRHLDLHATFLDHAGRAMTRLAPGLEMSEARLLLLGASFTHEYSIEGAALCNPSAVLHPRPDPHGAARFVMSVRGIGEGHRSSIGFRTGSLSAAGTVTIDEPGRFPRMATPTPGVHHKAAFHVLLATLGDDRDNAAYVLDPLPARFGDSELEARIEELAADEATRRHTATTITNLRDLSRSSYHVEFPATTDISERVLWPHAPAERNGMEDARFVRFIDGMGDAVYYATYTAYDGYHIAQNLLETKDFVTFTSSPLAGSAAAGKGLALFPRRIRGHYAALSRSDRETNSMAYSDDLRCWDTAEPVQVPERSWEILQLGNCGSPMETDDGWLVITHGVGAMRTYSLGAILLDLDEPHRVIARSEHPILTPPIGHADGYVPNVVYSCGGFIHRNTLVLPYGIADQSISVATYDVAALLAGLRPET